MQLVLVHTNTGLDVALNIENNRTAPMRSPNRTAPVQSPGRAAPVRSPNRAQQRGDGRTNLILSVDIDSSEIQQCFDDVKLRGNGRAAQRVILQCSTIANVVPGVCVNVCTYYAHVFMCADTFVCVRAFASARLFVRLCACMVVLRAYTFLRD